MKTRKTNLILIILMVVYNLLDGQNVDIPDPNFKSFLLESNNINTNEADEIQIAEAETFTGMINCAGRDIADLTGIEVSMNIINPLLPY